MTDTGSFDAAAFDQLRRELDTRLGAPLVTRALTASTNDDALAAALAGAPHGATFVADQQSAGRGRRGRRWHSTPGESLLASIVLRPGLAPERLASLPLVIGLAVRGAIAELAPALGADTSVKWPNDVWVGGRKIAGVLVESRVGAGAQVLVAGIGVNVSVTNLPDELRASSTSLALLGAHAPRATRERVLASVLAGLELRLARLSRSAHEIVAELRQHDALLGRRILVDGTGGTAAGIDDSGRLLLRLESGETRALSSGSVELDPLDPRENPASGFSAAAPSRLQPDEPRGKVTNPGRGWPGEL